MNRLRLLLPALLSAMALGGAVAWGESGASWLLAAHLPGTLAADHTAPVALLHALRTPGQLDVARDIAVELCTRLIEGGVDRLHFYTLNRPELTAEVCAALGIEATEAAA